MKKIIKPAAQEQSEYFCDFSGEKLVDYIPAELKICFGYGSKHDGFYLNLDLSDDAAEELLEFIKNKLSPQTKEKLKEKFEQVDNQYSDAMDARSWDECERYGNHKHLLQYLYD